MLHVHADQLRPDHTAGAILPSVAFALERAEIARSMADVILRNTHEGRATTFEDFREATETRGFTRDEIITNLNAARAIVDPIVIRQDAIPEAGDVAGIAEATPDAFIADELGEMRARLDALSNDELVDYAAGNAGADWTDDQLAGALLAAHLSPTAISRIWQPLKIRLASTFVQRAKPSLGRLAYLSKAR
jgi:hypothetical protein